MAKAIRTTGTRTTRNADMYTTLASGYGRTTLTIGVGMLAGGLVLGDEVSAAVRITSEMSGVLAKVERMSHPAGSITRRTTPANRPTVGSHLAASGRETEIGRK